MPNRTTYSVHGGTGIVLALALWAAQAPTIGVAAEPRAAAADTAAATVRREVCIECHEDSYRELRVTKHWEAADARTPAASIGCERCHGAGEAHVMDGGGPDIGGMTVFGGKSATPPDRQNGVCLACHQGGLRMHWAGSAHEAEDVVCADCHSIHTRHNLLAKARDPEACLDCHTQVRAEIHRAFTHPIRAGKMRCSGCHNPHGAPADSQLAGMDVNETCTACHAEKRGPFLWEHHPVSEDCTLCHSAHGSNNPALLTQRAPHLCQRCHQPTSEFAAQHARLALSYRPPGVDEIGPAPGFGDVGIKRFVLSRSCLHCHSQVHGSNHPSGTSLMR